jgi:hypothetical protein
MSRHSKNQNYKFSSNQYPTLHVITELGLKLRVGDIFVRYMFKTGLQLDFFNAFTSFSRKTARILCTGMCYSMRDLTNFK